MTVPLRERMQNVLAQASLIAEQSAAGLNEPTSHGKAGSKPPTISGTSTYDQIRRRFEACESDVDRALALEWAERLVRNTKRLAPRAMTADEQEFWATHKIENGAGKDYRTVAQETGLSEKSIWKIRERAELDPRYGTPKPKKAA